MKDFVTQHPEFGLIVGLLSSVLTATGVLDQAHADQLVQLINAIGSVVIISVSLISYFEHKTQIGKAKIAQGSTTVLPTKTVVTTQTGSQNEVPVSQ